ncbi:hypothetical protein Btru_053548 [Bulinus truncatus]|nr:hypothetical protein Btru_053548 [Bulinus truncatus]
MPDNHYFLHPSREAPGTCAKIIKIAMAIWWPNDALRATYQVSVVAKCCSQSHISGFSGGQMLLSEPHQPDNCCIPSI